MAISVPLINGVRHSYASIEAKVNGKRFYCTSLNYNEKNEFGTLRANSSMPLGFTAGDYSVDGDFEMPLEDFTDFLSVLAPSGTGYMNVMFDFDVTYQASGNIYVINHFISGVRMKEIGSSRSQGNEALREKVSFEALQLKRNGKFGLDVTLSLGFDI